MINNETDKMRTYVDIGLKINPQNKSLLSLRGFTENNQTGLIATIKSFFSK